MIFLKLQMLLEYFSKFLKLLETTEIPSKLFTAPRRSSARISSTKLGDFPSRNAAIIKRKTQESKSFSSRCFDIFRHKKEKMLFNSELHSSLASPYFFFSSAHIFPQFLTITQVFFLSFFSSQFFIFTKFVFCWFFFFSYRKNTWDGESLVSGRR